MQINGTNKRKYELIDVFIRRSWVSEIVSETFSNAAPHINYQSRLLGLSAFHAMSAVVV